VVDVWKVTCISAENTLRIRYEMVGLLNMRWGDSVRTICRFKRDGRRRTVLLLLLLLLLRSPRKLWQCNVIELYVDGT
jgi:hypothetical protein